MKLYTNKELNELAQKAFDDPAALAELGAINAKLARAANQRLRRLEAAGKTGDAYKRIQESIPGGGRRFSQAKTGSVEGLMKNINETQAALRQKESTLSGIKEVDRETVTSIFNKFGYDEPTAGQVRAFNSFLENKAWPEIKRVMGSDVLRQIADMVVNNEDISDMLDSFTEWAETPEEDRDDIFTMMEGWIEL